MSQYSNILYLSFLKKVGISSFLQDKPNFFYEIKNKEIISLNDNDKDIGQIESLEELESFFKKSIYSKFKIKSSLTSIGEGNKNAKVFIIGDHPDHKNQNNKTFSEESNNLLSKMLKSINLNTKDIYTSNIIKWPIKENQKIENEDILYSLPFIQRQIEIIDPKILLLMGSIPAKAILNSNLDITKLRGKWHNYKSINFDRLIECLVTYHPKFLIKFPKEKKYAWNDLQMLEKKIK
tara:strand:- start:195 stop:902 length:708 start_codon:yes stop_codon:yes gene_type:complete